MFFHLTRSKYSLCYYIKCDLNCSTYRKIKIGALLLWFWIVCFCGYSCLHQYLAHSLFYVKHQHSMTTHDQSIPSYRLLLSKFSIWVSRNPIKKLHQRWRRKQQQSETFEFNEIVVTINGLFASYSINMNARIRIQSENMYFQWLKIHKFSIYDLN